MFTTASHHQSARTQEVRHVESSRPGKRAAVLSDYIVTVVAGQVVTTPRNAVIVSGDGSMTIPLID